MEEEGERGAVRASVTFGACGNMYVCFALLFCASRERKHEVDIIQLRYGPSISCSM